MQMCKCCGSSLTDVEERFGNYPEYRNYLGSYLDVTVIEQGPLCTVCEWFLVDCGYGDTMQGKHAELQWEVSR
jgi:hypothetical protein